MQIRTYARISCYKKMCKSFCEVNDFYRFNGIRDRIFEITEHAETGTPHWVEILHRGPLKIKTVTIKNRYH